jgi:hypothetical protein
MSPDFPLISHAQVVGVNPATGYLQVAYPSIMGSAFPVRILHHGPADGLRVEQMPMPGIGTWGIVCAPYGDSRNAIWLGAYYTTGIDARTGDGDPYTKYHSHWSGAFEHMDGSGNNTPIIRTELIPHSPLQPLSPPSRDTRSTLPRKELQRHSRPLDAPLAP